MGFSAKVTSKWNGDIVKFKGKKVISNSLYGIGLAVEGQAKELAARKYGYMAASINTQMVDKGTELENPSKYAKESIPASHKVDTFRKIQKPSDNNECLVGSAVDYSPYKEFGTTKMAADPFLRPALELVKGEALNIVTVNGKKEFGEYIK